MVHFNFGCYFKGLNPSALFPEAIMQYERGGQYPRVYPGKYTRKETENPLLASGFTISGIHTVVDKAGKDLLLCTRMMRALM